ncbi:MAG: hypothetical protein ACREOO_18840 [bacterium]
MRITKRNSPAALGISIALVTLVFAGHDLVFAQAQQVKWLRVGSLHSWYSNWGAEIELGRVPGDLTKQQDGLRWPADFQFQDCEVGKAIWLGATNFLDPRRNEIFAHKVIGVGPRLQNVDILGETFPQQMKLVGRFLAPTVVVDNEVASQNAFDDLVDEVDPALPADRMIVNTLHTALGITMTRRVMAFAQPNHDNYLVYEYVFKNTGIIDNSGTIRPARVTGFVAHFQWRYATASEAFRLGWAPTNNVSWGRNTINEVVGQNPNAAGFEYRALYSWYGPHSLSVVDDWGAPNPNDGRLGGVHYMGNVVLHADRSATDKTDDPFQPRTTQYLSSDRGEYPGSAANILGPPSNQFNADLMSAKYAAMTAGHPQKTHAQEISNGFADQFGTDLGGVEHGQGFGPYDLEPGDSVRIVLAEAVAGLGRAKSREVGRNWYANSGSFVLPNGVTTVDRDEYKRLWVQTGQDSLFRSFRRALSNFARGYSIPQPPPPPGVFEVKSGGDRIQLTWSNNAESSPNFRGYRIYRAVAKPDTFYQKVFETQVPNVVNHFDDTSAQRGFDYYYYIESFDDGSTNDAHPGVPLASSRFYTITSLPAFLRRQAAASLAQIRIVPNPFDLRARDLQFAGAPDRIAFFGLPPECTIKIFTERGDLIETIEHTNGSGDEFWNSLTSSSQVVVSGLYVAHFETPDGQSTFRKFIIIR